MTVNRLLNQFHSGPEQEMVESLVIEAIQAKGRDMKYMLRDMVGRDYLFGESPISEFNDVAIVEMYLNDIQNFNGDGDLFTKFGMTFSDTAVFEVSVRRFREELKEYGLERPREGDLLYYDLGDSLYEIKKVKKDPNFNQVGVNYRYLLECSLFQFSHEKLPNTPDMEGFKNNSIVLSSESASKMAESLGISAKTFIEETPEIVEEAQNVIAFDPENPFGERP